MHGIATEQTDIQSLVVLRNLMSCVSCSIVLYRVSLSFSTKPVLARLRKDCCCKGVSIFRSSSLDVVKDSDNSSWSIGSSFS